MTLFGGFAVANGAVMGVVVGSCPHRNRGGPGVPAQAISHLDAKVSRRGLRSFVW